MNALPRAWLRRAGAPAKALALLALLLAATFARAPAVLALLAAALPLAALAGVRGLPRALALLAPLALLNALLLGALLPGTPVFLGPGLAWSAEGLAAGLEVTVRIALAMAAALAFAASTGPREVLALLRPAPRAALALAAAARFAPQAAEDLAEARDARALRTGGARRGARGFLAAVPALVPAFVRAVRRGIEVEAALRAAGFDGGPRACYARPSWSRRDAPLVAFAAVALALALAGVPG